MHICYYSLEEKLCSMFCQILPKWGLVNLKFKPEIGFHYFIITNREETGGKKMALMVGWVTILTAKTFF